MTLNYPAISDVMQKVQSADQIWLNARHFSTDLLPESRNPIQPAAGIAAAMSASSGSPPRELNVGKIQDALRADKVDLTRGGEDQTPYL